MPIALTSKLGFVLVGESVDCRCNTVAELVAYAKERPGQLSYGSTGIGATPHLAVEMFQRAAGLKMTHVPYRGMPQAINDVVAGHTQMVFTDPPMAQTLSADDKLRPLAVSTLERIPAMPNVPTLSELGYKDFEAVSWHMIVAPAGTPKPVVDRLHAEFKAIVASPRFPAAGAEDGAERHRLAAAGGAQALPRRRDRALGRTGEAGRHRRDPIAAGSGRRTVRPGRSGAGGARVARAAAGAANPASPLPDHGLDRARFISAVMVPERWLSG